MNELLEEIKIMPDTISKSALLKYLEKRKPVITPKLKYSWSAFTADLNILAEQVLQNSNLKYVTGIPRGGLPIAVALSHLTGLEYVQLGDIADLFRRNKLKHNISTRPDQVLLVDDISDSGQTLKGYQAFGYPIATLFHRNGSIVTPDYCANKTLNDSRWCVFPWEA